MFHPVSGFFRIFPDFFGFSSNLQISSQNRWITSQIWHNYPFRKFIRFLDSTWIFPEFSGLFRIIPDFFKFSDFYDSFHMFSENRWYTFQTWFVLLKIHPVSWFFPDFFQFLIFLRFFSYTFRYDMFYRKFPRLLDFFKFSDF